MIFLTGIGLLSTLPLVSTNRPDFYGQVPDLVRISGPTDALAGELLVFEAEGEADGFTWLVLPKTPHCRTFNDGKTFVMSSQGGVYTLVLGASKGGTVHLITHQVTVRGAASDGLNVQAWCQGMDKEEAMKLSRSFASVASVIDSGVLKTSDDIVAATSKSNRDALGSAVDKWKVFMEKLRDYLNHRKPQFEKHSAIWKRIAEELEAYAKS